MQNGQVPWSGNSNQGHGEDLADAELRAVASSALEWLRGRVAYRTASVERIQGDRRTFLIGEGFPEVGRARLARVSADPSVRPIVELRKPLWLDAPPPEWDPAAYPWSECIHSWLGVPVVNDDEVVGILTLGHEQLGFYTQAIRDILVSYADTLAPRILQACALDDAKRVSRDLTIVNEVLLVLGRNLGTEDLLLKIAQRTVERLSCQRCTIFVPDRECGEVVLTPRAALGWTGTPTRRFKLGEGLAGWAFSRGEPIMLGNPYDDPRFAPARSENTPPRSTLVVPVTVGGQSIGVICADHNEFDWFSDDDCSLVEILGQQLGIAIQRSITLTLLQDIGNRIASSQKVDDILREVISGAVRLTNTTSGSIYLLSDDGRKVLSSYQMADFRHPLPRLESPHGMTRMILETGRVLCVGDIVADPRVNPALRQVFRSMMGVPLKCDGKVVGVFYLNDVMPHDFSEAELSLVMLLATQAVIAIQMARSLQPPSYSCFLSYSSRDQAFATRLHADLRNDGVLCWFAPKDVRAGKKLHVQIDEAIRGSDRLLLILSEDSMNSEWVRTEISHARQKEVDEHRQVLFPISLVPFDKIGDWKCFDADIGKDSAREIREYFIPDFSNWLDSESYCHAYAKLVRDLKAERPKSDG